MALIRSFFMFLCGCLLLSSCESRAPASNATISEEDSSLSTRPKKQKKIAQDEFEEFSSEEASKPPRPQVVQIPSKS